VDCSHSGIRPNGEISLIVVHGISLPAGHFGGRFIEELFCKKLDTSAHNDFSDLAEVEVSSHLLITRDGSVLQFVPFDQCAWHAGASVFKGSSACNNFSVGIELEGTDNSNYTESQYQVLANICAALISTYDIPEENVVGHSDIAPGRKTDPGPLFEWDRFRKLVSKV
jgi:AmpD protein